MKKLKFNRQQQKPNRNGDLPLDNLKSEGKDLDPSEYRRNDEAPKSFQRLMEWKTIAMTRRKNKQSLREKQSLGTVDRKKTVEQLSKDILDARQDAKRQAKHPEKKEKMRKQLEKLKEKKTRKKRNEQQEQAERANFNRTKAEIFGHVVDRPPEITVRPKIKKKNQDPVAMLLAKKQPTSLRHRENMEKERESVIAKYRLLKQKKMQINVASR